MFGPSWYPFVAASGALVTLDLEFDSGAHFEHVEIHEDDPRCQYCGHNFTNQEFDLHVQKCGRLHDFKARHSGNLVKVAHNDERGRKARLEQIKEPTLSLKYWVQGVDLRIKIVGKMKNVFSQETAS